MKKITKVDSYLFDNFVLIAFSKDWINLMNAIPQFDVLIDEDSKLHLVSKQVIKK